MPPSRASSSSPTGIAKLFSVPSTSVNHSRMNCTLFSSACCNTLCLSAVSKLTSSDILYRVPGLGLACNTSHDMKGPHLLHMALRTSQAPRWGPILGLMYKDEPWPHRAGLSRIGLAGTADAWQGRIYTVLRPTI